MGETQGVYYKVRAQKFVTKKRYQITSDERGGLSPYEKWYICMQKVIDHHTSKGNYHIKHRIHNIREIITENLGHIELMMKRCNGNIRKISWSAR